MHRRHFLHSSILAATASSLPLRAATGSPLRYMLASCMYGDMPVATVAAEAKKTGATHLDLWPKKHGTQREEVQAMGDEKFAALLDQHGLKLGCCTRYDLGPFALADEIAWVKKFGADVIVTGASGNYKLTGDALKAEVQAFVEKMKPHVALAAQNGVTIAIENHVNSLIDTPDSLLWLADAIRNMEGIGIAFAPYHLPQDTKQLADLIRQHDKKLTLFYAWEHGMGCMKPMPPEEELQQMPGRGKLDFKPLLQALADIKFAGFTEIFMHHTPRGIAILPTAAEVTAEIVRAKQSLESQI